MGPDRNRHTELSCAYLEGDANAQSTIKRPEQKILYQFRPPSYILQTKEHTLQLYWSAWATITRYHRLGDLNNRNLFPHSLETESPRSSCQ